MIRLSPINFKHGERSVRLGYNIEVNFYVKERQPSYKYIIIDLLLIFIEVIKASSNTLVIFLLTEAIVLMDA